MTTALPSRRPTAAAADGLLEPPASGDGDVAALVDPCLARLDAAIDAARDLGLPVADAEAVRSDARSRLGFPADVFVVALVGGTGVGKSSLLNALAGASVSAASVRRPTTSTPVAWVPARSAQELAPLLDWLGIAPADVRRNEDASSGAIAIVDLPDLDSIDLDHRARVDAALPRVDAVVWVTDPEKYHDALLHDELLLRWLPRLGRQLVVVNKADRLTSDDAERLRRDLERDIKRLAERAGRREDERPRVVVTSALAGAPDTAKGRIGLGELRAWLAASGEAKRVIRARLLATVRDTIAALARAGGVDPAADLVPVLGPEARRAAADAAGDALLHVVDLTTLRRQATAATRARARARGAGPLGGITSRLFRWSGRQARVADPAAHLLRWRDRGTTGPAAGVVRAALAEPLRTAPPAVRRRLAADSDEVRLEADLTRAVDRAVAGHDAVAPTSRWWTVIGLAQTVATAAIVLAAAWVILWVLIRFPADSASLPGVGQVPLPLVTLIASLAAGYLLARLLGSHAGRVGRHWADALAERIRAGVRAEVMPAAFAPIDRLEAERRALWLAARGSAEVCADPR